jgi:hypothetical protein
MFGEVMHHFVVGGDKTCFQASDIGDGMVIAEHGNKKAEKKCQDSRESVTLYHTGTPGGTIGPTAFLLKGKMVQSGFTDNFLLRNGATQGSTIVMTESAFMTEKAWDMMTPKMIKGICSLPFVKDNLQ